MTYSLVSDKERREHDFYETRDGCDDLLVNLFVKRYSPFKTRTLFWECAVGKGALANPLVERGFNVISSDIIDYEGRPRICPFTQKSFYDFDSVPGQYLKNNKVVIFTNPPYGKDAEKFVWHAWNLAIDLYPREVDVWMLLRHTWDTGKKHSRFYLQQHIEEKHVMCWRPNWIEGTNKTGMHNSAWFKWSNFGMANEGRVFYHLHP